MAPLLAFSSSHRATHTSLRPPVHSGGAPVRTGIQRARTLQATAAPWYPAKLGPESPLDVDVRIPVPPDASQDVSVPVPAVPVDAQPLVSESGTSDAASMSSVACVQAVSGVVAATTPVLQLNADEQEQHAANEAAAVVCKQPVLAVTAEQPALAAVAPAEPAPAACVAVVPAASHSTPAYAASLSAVTDRSSARCNEHNSVTVKAETSVKDAAGAITHVLDRIFTLFLTALRSQDTHEALNRAVKSLAVARKYLKDAQPGFELTFLPLNRTSGRSASNCESGANAAAPDAKLFAFLVFKTVVGVALKEADETDLNVSRGSNVNKMANAIMSVILDRGQAVMKAGGADALFVAMSAVINARRRLQRKHGFDLMLVPEWITEDTTHTLGRESKFLRFNILKCGLNGPLDHSVRPALASA